MSKIAQFDLFTNPFQYTFVENKKSKQTVLGGLLSLVVLGVSLTYLGYLLYLYFGNQMQPTILNVNQHYSESFEMDFDSDQIAFQFKVGDKSMQQLEQSEGMKFLTLMIAHNIFTPDGELVQSLYGTMPCTDEGLEGYTCIDYSNQGTQAPKMTFTYRPEDFFTEQYLMFFIYCNPIFEAEDVVCAGVQDIQEKVLSQQSLILFKYPTQEFNPQTKQLERRVRQEYYHPASDFVSISQISFMKSEVRVSDGILIQTEDRQEYISNYNRLDTVNSFDFMQQQYKFSLYLQTSYFISGDYNVQRVQYQQVTTILAQFTSIFNMLLFLGLISKVFAQSEIVQDLIELQLKAYFKKTAVDMMYLPKLQRLKTLRTLKSFSSPMHNSEAGNLERKDTIAAPSKNTNGIDLNEMHKQIQQMNFKAILKGYVDNISVLKRIKYFFFSGIFKVKENEKDKKEVKVYKALLKQSQKSMSIFELQKEVINLKMMLRMVLSVEQYAAMQVCGVGIRINEKPANTQLPNLSNIQSVQEYPASSIDHEDAVFNSIEISEHQQNKHKESQQKIVTRHSISLDKLDNKFNSVTPSKFNVKKQFQGNFDLKQIQSKDFDSKQINQSKDLDFKQFQSNNFELKQFQSNNFDSKQIQSNKDFDQKQFQSHNFDQKQFQSNNFDQQLKANNYDPTFNHLEKIDLLESDSNYFEECLTRFIETNNKRFFQQSEIDKRILDCMIQLNTGPAITPLAATKFSK